MPRKLSESVLCLSCRGPLANTSEKCEKCGWAVPVQYWECSRQLNPLWIVNVGLTQHGKTSLLNGLFLVLDQLDTRLKSFYYDSLDESTHKTAIDVRSVDSAPPGTRNEERRLIAWHCPGSEYLRLQHRYLSFHDMPGEWFTTLKRPARELPVLAQSNRIWLSVSLRDLQETPGYTVQALFDSVHASLHELKAAPTEGKPRDLIVVFTKADKIDFQNEVNQYLEHDPLKEKVPLHIREYCKRLVKISDLLKEYTRDRVLKGPAFLSKAESNHYRVFFCVTSVVGEGNEASMDPRRVIDPLLLTLGGWKT